MKPARFALLGILLLAAAIRLYHLGSQPLWCDEWYGWQNVTRGSLLRDVLHIMVTDIYPPLYYMLTWVTTRVDDSLFYLRLVSALAGVAACGFSFKIARRYFSLESAVFVGLLTALSPMAVYYSQECKLYALFAAFSLWMLDEYLLLIEDPRRKAWRLSLAALACIYTGYLSPYFILPLMAHAALDPSRRKALKSFAWAILGALPLLPFFVKSSLIFTGMGVTPGTLLAAPWYSIQNFTLGFWAPEIWAEVAAVFCLIGIGLFCLKSLSPKAKAPWVLLLFSLMPPLLNWSISFLNPTFSDRAMLGVSFTLFILAVVGWEAVGLWPRRILLTGLLVLQAGTTWAWIKADQQVRPALVPAYAQVRQVWQPGDTVFHSDIQTLYSFKYQAMRDHVEMPNYFKNPVPEFPASAGKIREQWRKINHWLAKHDLEVYAGMEKSRIWEPRLSEEGLRGVKRLWYVSMSAETNSKYVMPHLNEWRAGAYVHEDETPEKRAWILEHGFRLANTRDLGQGITLFEYRLAL